MSEQIYCDPTVRMARYAVESELKMKKIRNQPIATFDPKTGEVYLKHSDGTAEKIESAVKWERYSERVK